MIDELKLARCGCGGEATVFLYETLSGHKEYLVICTKCGICIPSKSTETAAIQTWNRAMGVKDINVTNKDTVIIKPFTTDMNHIGYCKCGYLVNAEWKYCPHCGARLEWK